MNCSTAKPDSTWPSGFKKSETKTFGVELIEEDGKVSGHSTGTNGPKFVIRGKLENETLSFKVMHAGQVLAKVKDALVDGDHFGGSWAGSAGKGSRERYL